MDWIDLAQDKDGWGGALVNWVINILVPQSEENFLSSSGLVSFSERTLLHGIN